MSASPDPKSMFTDHTASTPQHTAPPCPPLSKKDEKIFEFIKVQNKTQYEVGNAGEGRLYSAQQYIVKKDRVIFRVHSKGNAYGHWWSLSDPRNKKFWRSKKTFSAATQKKYQRQNVICSEWQKFEEFSTGILIKGAIVSLGCGQAAACNNDWLPAQPKQQVYIKSPQDAVKNVETVDLSLKK